MYTSIVTICEFVVIFMYLTRNCTVYVNKIYVLFCSVPKLTLTYFTLLGEQESAPGPSGPLVNMVLNVGLIS